MYQTILDAIRDHACLTAHYEYNVRFFAPHALGKDSSGAPLVVAYQYAGGRRGGLPAGGDWATFYIGGLSSVELTSDKWLAGRLTHKPMHVLKDVDLAA